MESANTKKEAYFNIPDLHAFYSLSNRYDYAGEILGIVERIGRLVKQYKNEGYLCYSILNGDVAHRGHKNDTLNDVAVQAIKLLLSFFDDNFMNFGNHEFTYYKNNPVLKFIETIEDSRILSSYPHIKPTSTVPTLKSIRKIEYDNFEILFTPFGFYPDRPSKDTSLVIVHDDIMSDHAYNKHLTDHPEYSIYRKLLLPDEYTYVFCGHGHMIYETWNLGKTVVYNMASLGRTSVSEVSDDFRERLIPTIIVHDGEFVRVEDEVITLHKRVDIVDEEKVLLAKQQYEHTKARKIEKAQLSINSESNPVEALTRDVEESDSPYIKAVWDILLTGQIVNLQRLKTQLEIGDYDNDGD